MDNILKEPMYSISRADFFDLWMKSSNKSKIKDICSSLLRKFKVDDQEKEVKENFFRVISENCKQIARKWVLCGRRQDRFKKKYIKWIECENIVLDVLSDGIQREKLVNMPSSSSASRQIKSFTESSQRTQSRRARRLLNFSTEELASATASAVRSEGKRDAAKIIKEMAVASPRRATTVKKLRSEKGHQQRAFTPEEALAHYVDYKCTTHTYILMRKHAIAAGHNLYPSFHALRKAKEACFPNTISCDEISVSVEMQDLLDLTVKRLFLYLDPVIKERVPSASSLTLISKWGGDGSSGHSQYKQTFQNKGYTDEYLFVLSFVPLTLHINDDNQTIIWKNPRPSSTRLCRPIKFIFEKETNNLCQKEFKTIQSQIDQLTPTTIGNSLKIKHKLLRTMVDGKMVSVLSNTKGAQNCYICGSKPSNMNSIPVDTADVQENYSYGLSTLHAWIKIFECLLHIAYRMTVKVWQVRSAEQKIEFERRKKEIQEKFKNEMGLCVDKPKPGFGTTNDGNTARTFFKKSGQSAAITGLDETLILRLRVILSAISSGFDINLEKFELYTKETRALYINLYSWYYMPVTLHKILNHSTAVIKSCIVPIGQLSEEAQEARNKDCRRFREFNTRKCSREATNRDLFTMLIITSDPLINSFRETPRKNIESFSSDVLELLDGPAVSGPADPDITPTA